MTLSIDCCCSTASANSSCSKTEPRRGERAVAVGFGDCAKIVRRKKSSEVELLPEESRPCLVSLTV